ncbi:MAG TPA: hypothetical protein VMI52_12715 [Acetobacteraceae bacterium]|nr:hypothetical protein [Acetobacteraceae bacterium]
MNQTERDESIAAFLRANPSWLAERPELYRCLAPPQRVHGERLADHMAAMVQAERAQAAAMTAQAEAVLAACRATTALTLRVQEAVLALMRSPDPADCVAVEMPGLLGVDAATLCAEGFRPGLRHLPPGHIERLLAGRDVAFRAMPDDAPLLHAEAALLARHDALVRVPAASPTLLALACRDPWPLSPQGAGALGFLGRALAAALERAGW